MEYQNIIIFILIFIIFIVIFYLIINNLGITNVKNENYNISELTNKISSLKNEISDLKYKIIISDNNNNNNNNNSNSNCKNEESIKEIIIDTNDLISNSNNSNQNLNNLNENINNKPPPIIYDPIANYDIAKLTDPLVDPRGRTSADQIPTPQIAAQFNFPTQGVLDRYHRVGLLISINNEKTEKYNKFGIPYYDDEKLNKKKNKKKKRYVQTESDNSIISYKGIEIKENFDSDSDSDSEESFGNTNIYNVYSNENDNTILELIGRKINDNWYKYFTSITMGNKIIKVVVRNKNQRELYSGDIVFIPEIKKTYRVKIDPMDIIEYNPYLF